jgi:hypothetical protein
VLAGVAALTLLKNKHKAQGYFVGATLIGLAPIGWNALAKVPFLSDYVNVGVDGYGLMVDAAPMGLFVDTNQRLAGLASYSMGEADESYVP